MLTWCVKTTDGAMDTYDMDIVSIIDSISKNRCICNEHVKCMEYYMKNLILSNEMKNIVQCILSLVAKKPSDFHVNTCFIEVLCGLHYGATNPGMGNLEKISNAYNRNNKKVIERFKLYLQRLLQYNMYNKKCMMFFVRVRLMDVYAIMIALNCTSDTVIYYAGQNHTIQMETILKESYDFVHQHRNHEIFEQVSCNTLTHISQLYGAGKTVIILGEYHNRTNMRFARDMIKYLKSICSMDTKITLMIERHIHKGNDTVQEFLTCQNKSKYCIQNLRCDPFVERNHKECNSLDILSVDNRHIDCGFFRNEITDCFDTCNEFRKCIIQYNKACCMTLLEKMTNLIES